MCRDYVVFPRSENIVSLTTQDDKSVLGIYHMQPISCPCYYEMMNTATQRSSVIRMAYVMIQNMELRHSL